MKKVFALCLALVYALTVLNACTISWESGKEGGDATADTADLAAAKNAGGDDLKDLTVDTYIELNNDSASVTGDGASFENGVLTVTKSGTYSLKGTLTDGQIVVNTEDDGKVKLLFDGVNVHSETGAPLLVLSSPKETKLLLAAGSENTLSDSATRTAQDDDPDAVIFSKDDLEISGTGTLNIEANYKRGVNCKDALQISGGTLNVTAADDALRGKEGVDISGGVLNIRSEGDGIQASDEEKGSLTVSGGVLTLNTGKDGLQAEAALNVSGGVLDITSGNDALKGAANVTISGGTLTIDAENDGIHADADLTLSAGSVTIKQSKEGLEGTTVTLSGAVVDVTASDDGINAAAPGSSDSEFTPQSDVNGKARRPEDGSFSLPADEDFTLPTDGNGRPEPPDGGSFTLPEKSFDGSGETTVAVGFTPTTANGAQPEPPTGGNFTPPTDENGRPQRPDGGSFTPPTDENGNMQRPDGANGFGGFGGGQMGGFGYDSASCITITAGSITVNAGGDGVDSNGDIKMTGGSVTVYGPTNSGNSALDYGGSFEMTGGTLLAVGSAGMAQSISSGLAAVAVNCEIGEGDKVEIRTESGKTLTGFTAPKKIGHIVYADESVKSGESYTVVVNGNTISTAAAK